MSKHRLTKRSVRRALSLTAASAMVFALAPAGSAFAQQASIGNEDVCPPPGETLNDEFNDDDGGTHEENINCVVAYDIAQGYPDGTYRPGVIITRDQMATFIANYVETGLGEALPQGGDHFTDDDGNVHENNINKIAEAGIVLGTGNALYAPKAIVTRGAMATFISNAIDYLDDREVNGSIPPASTQDHFNDDDGTTHEDNINRLAEQGIVQGKADGGYDPLEGVTRAQMATFVIHAAEYADELGLWAPTAGAANNQAFDVTPNTAATNTVSTEVDPGTNRGARTYSVSGLDDTKAYAIALFDPARITVGDNGNVTFRDTEGTTTTADDNDRADDICQSQNFAVVDGDPDGALIEAVNGADVVDAKCVFSVSPTNGSITFVIDSETTDAAQPVVFNDADNDRQLDLDANNAPTEAFGVGGAKNWVPAEAAFGPFGVDVVAADTAQNFFVGEDLAGDPPTNEGTFYYDDNDLYTVSGTRVSMAEFEAVLSVGDDVEGTYRTEPSGVSEFNLTDTGPAAPTNVTATAGDFDNDAQRDDVRVNWTASATSGVDYDVKRVTDATPLDAADDTAICTNVTGTVVANDINATQFTDLNVPDGTYYYCVRAEQGTGEVQSESAWVRSNQVAVPAPADVDDPRALDTELTTSGGFANRLDSGDVIEVCFDEPLQAPDAGDAIQVQDETATPGTFDGDIATLVNGQNAAFALGTASTTDVRPVGAADETACPANQTLVITVTGPVSDQNTAGNGIVEIPALITDAAGVTDLSGNAWRPDAEDADRVIDIETAAEPS